MCVWDVACAQIEKSTDTWSSPKTDRQATLPPQRRTYLLFGILLKSRTYAVGTESVVRHVRAADMSRSSTPLAICPQLRRGILERRSPPTRPHVERQSSDCTRRPWSSDIAPLRCTLRQIGRRGHCGRVYRPKTGAASSIQNYQ